MADYEQVLAQLNSITDDTANLDDNARNRILDATMSCSLKLIVRSPNENSDAFNDSQVPAVYPSLLQSGSMDTHAASVTPKWDSYPTEIPWTSDPTGAGFIQQSTEPLPSPFVPLPESQSLNQTSIGLRFDQQYAQNPCLSHTEMDTSPEMYDQPAVHSALSPHDCFVPNLSPAASADRIAGRVTVSDGTAMNRISTGHRCSYMEEPRQTGSQSFPSVVNQFDINHSYYWPTGPLLSPEVDSSIFEEPVTPDLPMELIESYLPDGFPQQAYHGSTVTPEHYVDSRVSNTLPTPTATSEDFVGNLPAEQEQRLCNTLRATRVRSAARHLAPTCPAKIIKKKTKSLEEKRRIAETRRKGVCLLCSRDKVKCSNPEGPCDHCTKAIGSILGSHICLTGLQIRRSKIDGSFGGHLWILWNGKGLSMHDSQSLRRWRPVVEGANGQGKEGFQIIINERYGNSTAQLQYSTHLSDWSRISMDIFLDAYRDVSPALPMRDCVVAVLKLRSGIDQRIRLHQSRSIREKSAGEEEFSHDEQDEKMLLGMLDEHLSCGRKYHFIDSVILGLCIRRLSLYYKQMLELCRITDRHSHNLRLLSTYPLLRGSRSMYDACLSAYSIVYRKGKSPFSANWRLEEHLDEFGNDAVLVEKFRGIMRAERKHYNALDDKNDDDRLLRTLFLSTKQRGVKSWSA